MRDFAVDKYGHVDDTPYGGGAGMILRIEPIYKTLRKILGCGLTHKNKRTKKTIVIGFSAAGKKIDQKELQKLSTYENIIMLAGRYEGYDARVTEFLDVEYSIGDYVLTGGELPAMVLIDGVTRLIPGVLGNKESALDDSHAKEGVLEYPQYTKPEVFEYKTRIKNKELRTKELKVPEVLLSGHHKNIKEWREKNRKK